MADAVCSANTRTVDLPHLRDQGMRATIASSRSSAGADMSRKRMAYAGLFGQGGGA